MAAGNMKLIKIAAIGGVLTVSMGLAYQHKVMDNIRKTEHYKEALKTLRTHKAAVQLLGEPIKEGRLNFTGEKNYTKNLSAHYEVPVKGPNNRGTLFIWAKRKETTEPYTVTRLELGLKNEPNRRLLIKNTE